MNPAISETRISLILRLQDQRDIAAWDHFVAIYQPLVFRLARSRGFQETDAHDIVQEVMIAVSKAIHRWEPDCAKGRFRDWLFRIARNMMINFLTRRKYQSLGNHECVVELLEMHPEFYEVDADVTQEFDLEYRRELFWIAADKVRSQVRANTWDAFRLTAIEDLSVSKAARQLGMKEGAVLVARCRVLARLREAIAEFEAQDDMGANDAQGDPLLPSQGSFHVPGPRTGPVSKSLRFKIFLTVFRVTDLMPSFHNSPRIRVYPHELSFANFRISFSICSYVLGRLVFWLRRADFLAAASRIHLRMVPGWTIVANSLSAESLWR